MAGERFIIFDFLSDTFDSEQMTIEQTIANMPLPSKPRFFTKEAVFILGEPRELPLWAYNSLQKEKEIWLLPGKAHNDNQSVQRQSFPGQGGGGAGRCRDPPRDR
jgi:hypothetical protein